MQSNIIFKFERDDLSIHARSASTIRDFQAKFIADSADQNLTFIWKFANPADAAECMFPEFFVNNQDHTITCRFIRKGKLIDNALLPARRHISFKETARNFFQFQLTPTKSEYMVNSAVSLALNNEIA